MPKIIRNSIIEEDEWVLVKEADNVDTLPTSNVIVPLQFWLDNKAALKTRGNVSVWLDSDQGPDLISADLSDLPLIALNFPAFTDGRGYSYARLLREKFDYKGELRAIGDVLQDQLFFMKRCGIDSYVVRTDKDIEKALLSMNDFSESYQAAVDQPVPLFRRR